MAARAMWKGVIGLGKLQVPVKLYSAVEDRTVHFRLLSREDEKPVRQALVNPETDEPVPSERTQRAYVSEDGDMVLLDADELESLEPPKSRDISVLKFVPQALIDHRWYDRPYYLGPDDDEDAYFALAEVLDGCGREGLVHWVMRGKEYLGALRSHCGYPILMSLRHAEEVVPAGALEAPKGKPLDTRELSMAKQLIEMLEAKFEPSEWKDEYRERVMQMIDEKAQGKPVKVVPFKRREASVDLAAALEASLKKAPKRRSA